MKQTGILLDFKSLTLTADLFDSRIARNFAANLPYEVNLVQWGRELYGSIGIDLGEEHPVPDIPPGGIAYTRKGNYVCIFLARHPRGRWNISDRFKTMTGKN